MDYPYIGIVNYQSLENKLITKELSGMPEVSSFFIPVRVKRCFLCCRNLFIKA